MSNSVEEKFKNLSNTEKEELRKFYIDWLKDSTSRILPKIFRDTKTHIKLLWIIYFIVCGTVSFCLTINYLKTYLAYKVVLNRAIIYESPQKFPAVTICNINRFHPIRAQAYIDMVLEKNNLTNWTQVNSNQMALHNLTSILDIVRASVASNTTISQADRQLLGFNISEMLLSCSFNGFPCGVSNFSWIQSYKYGNCYVFNSVTDFYGNPAIINEVRTGGLGSGLELELSVGASYETSLVYKRGIYASIHNQSSQDIDEEGYYVPTGFETNFGVTRIFNTKLGRPYSSCKVYMTSIFSPLFQEFNQTIYNRNFCFKLCMQLEILTKCHCTDPSLPFSNKSNITQIFCNNATEIQCLINTTSSFNNDKCSHECPLECLFISYQVQSSISTYPTDFYFDNFLLKHDLFKNYTRNTTTINQLKSSVLKLNVFYNDLTYQTISEQPALTWDALIGNIGGMLSLFIGVSVLTFGEIMELIIELIRLAIWGRTHEILQLK